MNLNFTILINSYLINGYLINREKLLNRSKASCSVYNSKVCDSSFMYSSILYKSSALCAKDLTEIMTASFLFNLKNFFTVKEHYKFTG